MTKSKSTSKSSDKARCIQRLPADYSKCAGKCDVDFAVTRRRFRQYIPFRKKWNVPLQNNDFQQKNLKIFKIKAIFTAQKLA